MRAMTKDKGNKTIPQWALPAAKVRGKVCSEAGRCDVQPIHGIVFLGGAKGFDFFRGMHSIRMEKITLKGGLKAFFSLGGPITPPCPPHPHV